MDIDFPCGQVFAAVAPVSTDAEQALGLRHNYRHLVLESELLNRPPSSGGRNGRLIRLDFTSLLGRRCFSFGSSRSSNIQLPKADDICPQHFILFFDLCTQLLCIKDTSLHGIWLSSLQTEQLPPRHLHNITVPLTSSMQLQFGDFNRFHFRLILAKRTLATESLFANQFAMYARSIGHNNLQPRTKKRPRSSSSYALAEQYKRQKLDVVTQGLDISTTVGWYQWALGKLAKVKEAWNKTP